MKKKQKKMYQFPSNRRTEFAKFTDPDVFPLEPDTEDADQAQDSFFHGAPDRSAGEPEMF